MELKMTPIQQLAMQAEKITELESIAKMDADTVKLNEQLTLLNSENADLKESIAKFDAELIKTKELETQLEEKQKSIDLLQLNCDLNFKLAQDFQTQVSELKQANAALELTIAGKDAELSKALSDNETLTNLMGQIGTIDVPSKGISLLVEDGAFGDSKNYFKEYSQIQNPKERNAFYSKYEKEIKADMGK